MKKIKKLLAMIMAMTMVLGLGLTSFAAIGGASIHVSGLSTNGTQTVNIYEIFRLDKNNNLWVPAEWVPDGVQPENLSASIDALVDAENKTPAADPVETTTGVADFSGLQAGAYLVIASDGAGKVTYNPMIAVTYKYDESTKLLVATTANVIAKAESYTTDKTAKDEDAIVAVGDILTYEITTTVPFVDENAEEPITEFWVRDTISGASYYFGDWAEEDSNTIWSVKVGKEDISETHQAVIVDGSFDLDLSDLLANNTYAGQQVVITYTVKVNAVDKVTNKALSSNDPDADTTTGKTETYTGKMQITKYGEDPDGDGPQVRPVLKGAQFAVYRVNESTQKKEYAKIVDGWITGEWINEDSVEDEGGLEAIGTVTTDETGVAIVKGLDVGEYYFQEVVAPDGYSINNKDKDCEIVVTKDALTDETNGAFGSTEMTDTKLASLPSTGGIGTTIFTIGGCAIMIAAAALYFVNRRKSEEN